MKLEKGLNMNVPELRECAKLLHSVGILEEEKDIMDFVFGLGMSYELDIAELDDYLQSKYPEYVSKSCSMQDFFIELGGEQFCEQFKKFI